MSLSKVNNQKTCVSCCRTLPDEQFPISGRYTKKNGVVSTDRRNTCKACYAGKYRGQRDERYRKRIRRVNQLINWRIAAILMVVVGYYSHEYIKGTTKTCVYDSTYGSHAMTIGATQVCPMTMEFEI